MNKFSTVDLLPVLFSKKKLTHNNDEWTELFLNKNRYIEYLLNNICCIFILIIHWKRAKDTP